MSNAEKLAASTGSFYRNVFFEIEILAIKKKNIIFFIIFYVYTYEHLIICLEITIIHNIGVLEQVLKMTSIFGCTGLGSLCDTSYSLLTSVGSRDAAKPSTIYLSSSILEGGFLESSCIATLQNQ